MIESLNVIMLGCLVAIGCWVLILLFHTSAAKWLHRGLSAHLAGLEAYDKAKAEAQREVAE